MQYQIINNQTDKKKTQLQKELSNFAKRLQVLTDKSHRLLNILRKVSDKKQADKIVKKLKKSK